MTHAIQIRSILAGAMVMAAAVAIRASTPQTAPRDFFFQPLPALEHPVGFSLWFSPRDNIEEQIIHAIDGSQTEVLVNHYLITNPRVMDALQRAFERKCVVMVLLDAAPAVRDYQGFNELRRRHVPFAKVQRPTGRWNNSKYIIVDRSQVITGTADLSNTAAGNDETLFALAEPSVVIAFYNHFVSTAFPKSSNQ